VQSDRSYSPYHVPVSLFGVVFFGSLGPDIVGAPKLLDRCVYFEPDVYRYPSKCTDINVDLG